jgi:uncharacterized damage-inducible protein DinB
MHTSAGLTDLHARTHQCLRKLLDHCAGFTDEELRRPLEGFGYGSVLEQFHHLVGSEAYWVGVLEGRMLVDEEGEMVRAEDADRSSIDVLRAFRDRTSAATAAYLGSATDAELNTRRTVTAWGGRQLDLVPAHVVLRTQTHVFQHQGQVAAMCRLLARPVPPGLDFPLG